MYTRVTWGFTGALVRGTHLYYCVLHAHAHIMSYRRPLWIQRVASNVANSPACMLYHYTCVICFSVEVIILCAICIDVSSIVIEWSDTMHMYLVNKSCSNVYKSCSNVSIYIMGCGVIDRSRWSSAIASIRFLSHFMTTLQQRLIDQQRNSKHRGWLDHREFLACLLYVYCACRPICSTAKGAILAGSNRCSYLK